METGHNKNVTNFEQVIIILISLGAVYNPSQALILIPALEAKLAEAQAALAALDTAEADKKIKINAVQAGFEGVAKYAVNIKRTVEVELNDEAITRNMQTIVNKFSPSGRKTGLQDDPNTPEDESRTAQSLSQRSRDNQIAYLADMLALINRRRDDYNPNDAEYTIAGIEAKIAELTALNNAAKTAEAALGNAIDARDAALYDEQTGVLKLVKLIKTQLAKTPGKDSSAYRQVNALEFRKVKP